MITKRLIAWDWTRTDTILVREHFVIADGLGIVRIAVDIRVHEREMRGIQKILDRSKRIAVIVIGTGHNLAITVVRILRKPVWILCWCSK